MMIRRTCLLFLLLLIGAITPVENPSLAQVAPEPAAIDQYLVQVGRYPIDVVRRLPAHAKQDLFNSRAVYADHQQLHQRMEDRPRGEIQPLTLEEYNFYAQILRSAVPNLPPGRLMYKFTYTWDWSYTPFWSLTDKFGMAWSDDFDVLNAYWEYTAHGKRTANLKTFYATQTWGDSSVTEASPGTGVGWEFDMVKSFYRRESWGWAQYLTYHHSGWGTVTVGRWSNKSGAFESTSAVGRYFHKQATIMNANLQFSRKPTLAIDVGAGYDSSRTSTTEWTWTHEPY